MTSLEVSKSLESKISMKFTGERYVPSERGVIQYEHIHRYAAAQAYCKDKIVLDIASGEGYGSALLSSSAKKVSGVDIDPDSIKYASVKYSHHDNLEFLLGSCARIPLSDSSIDVVTSFETIEHHNQHEEMMTEIRRVLKPDGSLIISSPNKLIYSDNCNYQNPYHIKELYYHEFKNLLSRHFKYVWIGGQRIASSSFLVPVEEYQNDETLLESLSSNLDGLSHKVISLSRPMYFVAICSATKNQLFRPSIYLDFSDDLYAQDVESLQRTQADLQRTQADLQHTQAELVRVRADWQQDQGHIEWMKSSKFWRARDIYKRIKSSLLSKK